MRDTWCVGKATPETPFRYCTTWRETPGPSQGPDLPEDPVGFPIDQPVDLDTFIAMAWRVSRWSYSVSVIPKGVNAPALSAVGSIRPRSWFNTEVTEMEAGEEYRLGGNLGCLKTSDLPPQVGSSGTWVLGLLGSHQYYAPAGDDSAFFRPGFRFNYRLIDDSNDQTLLSINTVGTRAISQGLIVGTGCGTALIVIGGVNYSCGLYVQGNALIGLNPADYPICSVTLRDADYWRRADKEGNDPVWDGEGIQLRSNKGLVSEAPDVPVEIIDSRTVREVIFIR